MEFNAQYEESPLLPAQSIFNEEQEQPDGSRRFDPGTGNYVEAPLVSPSVFTDVAQQPPKQIQVLKEPINYFGYPAAPAPIQNEQHFESPLLPPRMDW